MLTPMQAKAVVEKRFDTVMVGPEYVEINDEYVVNLVPKDDTEGKLLDAMISVNKRTGAVKEFSPFALDDPDDFFERSVPRPFAI